MIYLSLEKDKKKIFTLFDLLPKCDLFLVFVHKKTPDVTLY